MSGARDCKSSPASGTSLLMQTREEVRGKEIMHAELKQVKRIRQGTGFPVRSHNQWGKNKCKNWNDGEKEWKKERKGMESWLGMLLSFENSLNLLLLCIESSLTHTSWELKLKRRHPPCYLFRSGDAVPREAWAGTEWAAWVEEGEEGNSWDHFLNRMNSCRSFAVSLSLLLRVLSDSLLCVCERNCINLICQPLCCSCSYFFYFFELAKKTDVIHDQEKRGTKFGERRSATSDRKEEEKERGMRNRRWINSRKRILFNQWHSDEASSLIHPLLFSLSSHASSIDVSSLLSFLLISSSSLFLYSLFKLKLCSPVPVPVTSCFILFAYTSCFHYQFFLCVCEKKVKEYVLNAIPAPVTWKWML